MRTAISIAAHLTNHRPGECWPWVRRDRRKSSRSGVVIVDGERKSARRVLIEWVAGSGYKYHCVKPVCGNDWCHNPFHHRITERISDKPDEERNRCKRGHDLTQPDSYWTDSKGNRNCIACVRFRNKTSYKYQSVQLRKEKKARRKAGLEGALNDFQKDPPPLRPWQQ